ncbi:MAG: hypothetical protein Q8K48_04295 [Candidatus Planktophila sp.]|nr:hypothetical protein [Candidatus Planktophila sp.]
MKFGIHSEQYQNKHSKKEGAPEGDESVQELVKQHYNAVYIWADRNL